MATITPEFWPYIRLRGTIKRALPDDQERSQNESSQEAEYLSPICIGIGSAEITVWQDARPNALQPLATYLPNVLRKGFEGLPGVPNPVTLSQPGFVCWVGEPE
jgi:hypothetical protein